MRHRLPSALLLALLAAGLTACSDDPEPDVADPTSSTPAPTPTSAEPTSDPPTTSATAEPQPESAEHFIRRWHQVSDEMQTSGETGAYLALGPNCPTCRKTARLISGYYEAGGYIRYTGTKVLTVKKTGSVGDVVEFDVALDSPPSTYRESAAAAEKSFAGGRNSIRIQLQRSGSTWVVVDYSVLAS